MDNNEPGTPVDSTLGYTFQNDFLALTQAFSLPEIDYTDISQREQLAAAIKRWPYSDYRASVVEWVQHPLPRRWRGHYSF